MRELFWLPDPRPCVTFTHKNLPTSGPCDPTSLCTLSLCLLHWGQHFTCVHLPLATCPPSIPSVFHFPSSRGYICPGSSLFSVPGLLSPVRPLFSFSEKSLTKPDTLLFLSENPQTLTFSSFRKIPLPDPKLLAFRFGHVRPLPGFSASKLPESACCWHGHPDLCVKPIEWLCTSSIPGLRTSVQDCQP
jgi:hypothetical protein